MISAELARCAGEPTTPHDNSHVLSTLVGLINRRHKRASHLPLAWRWHATRNLVIAHEDARYALGLGLYRFGLSVGARTLSRAPRDAIKRLVLPVEYIRCAEFRYVLEHLDVTANHRVLDIGSPKLLSLFLAARVGAHVWATDLLDYFFPGVCRVRGQRPRVATRAIPDGNPGRAGALLQR